MSGGAYKRHKNSGLMFVFGKLPTYPSPNLTLNIVTGTFSGELSSWSSERCPATNQDLYINWISTAFRNISFIAGLDSFNYKQNSKVLTKGLLSCKIYNQ